MVDFDLHGSVRCAADRCRRGVLEAGMTDPAPWLEAIGGGLSAVVIVVEAMVIIALWKRVNECGGV